MRSNRFLPTAALGALMFFAFRASGCVDNFEIGRDALGSDAGGEGGAAMTAGGAPGAGGDGACRPVACRQKVYACGDCVDNDMDGALDSADVECTGACDDTEDSFYGGIPGQNNAPCRQDCYFDSNSGSGDDGCYWTHECDVESVAENGYPPSGNASCAYNASATVPGSDLMCSGLASSQTDQCNDVCRAVTPNGCDCFGCCELPGRSNEYVFIGSTVDGQGSCNESNIDDPTACRPCTPVQSCFNECTPCEHCVGGVTPEPSCADGEAGAPGVSERCDQEGTPCGQVGEPECPAEEYCITGCCVVVLK
jgi:hypothetical protein